MNIREIENSAFLKNMTVSELESLSEEIRDFVMHSVADTGGHFSSNLGVVEMTVALHYVFNFPKDKLIFDVGHQSYVHKILSGRAKDFGTLRQYGGLSGFQKRSESEYDLWEAGHSSTAIAAANGIASARTLQHDDYEVVAVVGDAALMSGESFEALNNLGTLKTKVIVILNDNGMSITRPVGGFSEFLNDVRTSKTYANARHNYRELLSRLRQGDKVYDATRRVKDKVKDAVTDDSLFGTMGIDYVGPIDGHNIRELIRVFEYAKNSSHSMVIHLETKKGKGYAPAEKDKFGVYHGVPHFDLDEGVVPVVHTKHQTWSELVSNHVEQLMHDHKDICVITPAMRTGSSLNNIFKRFPKRSFDVGISEDYALTFAAGLSVSGLFPFVSIYSSFSQRAYDQLNHDICRMNLPLLLGIDRAGLVGGDGATHHGVFDVSYMMALPYLVIMSPRNQAEAQKMINTAYVRRDAPYVMRYSKNSVHKHPEHTDETLEVGSWEKLSWNNDYGVTVVAYGDGVRMAEKLVLEKQYPVNVVNARFLKPMDETMLKEMAGTRIIVYEEIMRSSSLGEAMLGFYNDKHIDADVTRMTLGDHYITHGNVATLLDHENMGPNGLSRMIEEILNNES